MKTPHLQGVCETYFLFLTTNDNQQGNTSKGATP